MEGVFDACIETLGPGDANVNISGSWCSWTTYSRLERDAGYWTAGIPEKEDVGEAYICDGGVWGATVSV